MGPRQGLVSVQEAIAKVLDILARQLSQLQPTDPRQDVQSGVLPVLIECAPLPALGLNAPKPISRGIGDRGVAAESDMRAGADLNPDLGGICVRLLLTRESSDAPAAGAVGIIDNPGLLGLAYGRT
jgi:hypothetical protein